MKPITRRSFVKRSSSGTLAAALGLSTIPSMTQRLKATDTSGPPPEDKRVRYRPGNILGAPLTGNPAQDGCTWRLATAAEIANVAGAVYGLVETVESNWTVDGYAVRSRAISRTFMSALPNECVQPLWVWRVISLENQVTFEGDAYTTRSTVTTKHRIQCEDGTPRMVLYSIQPTYENADAPPGQLQDDEGNPLSTGNNEETDANGPNYWTAGLGRQSVHDDPTMTDRGEGVFNTDCKPVVDTNYAHDYPVHEPDPYSWQTQSIVRVSLYVECCLI